MKVFLHENFVTRKFPDLRYIRCFLWSEGASSFESSYTFLKLCVYSNWWNSPSLSRSWDTWTREWKWCVVCMCPSTYCPRIVRASLDLDKGVGVIKCYCTMYILRITQHRLTCDRPVCLISHCHLPSFFSQLWPVWPCLQKLPLR